MPYVLAALLAGAPTQTDSVKIEPDQPPVIRLPVPEKRDPPPPKPPSPPPQPPRGRPA